MGSTEGETMGSDLEVVGRRQLGEEVLDLRHTAGAVVVLRNHIVAAGDRLDNYYRIVAAAALRIRRCRAAAETGFDKA